MERARLHQPERAAIAAQCRDDLVEHAGVWRKDALHHRDDDDRRQKVRQVGDRLRDLLELRRADLVEQKRQDDRKRELQNALDEADVQRVENQAPAIVGTEEHLEVPEADPVAPPDAPAEGIILERQHVARDRDVADQDVVHDRRQQQQIQRPAVEHPLPQRRVLDGDSSDCAFPLHTPYPILSLRLVSFSDVESTDRPRRCRVPAAHRSGSRPYRLHGR